MLPSKNDIDWRGRLIHEMSYNAKRVPKRETIVSNNPPDRNIAGRRRMRDYVPVVVLQSIFLEYSQCITMNQTLIHAYCFAIP